MITTPPAPRRWQRTRAATAGALALALSVPGLAAAQENGGQTSEATVSTSALQPGRNLSVHDMTGASFDENNTLRLRNGVPRPFEVRVTDVEQAPDRPIHVQASMNNLHRLDGEGARVAEHIAARDVTMSFSNSPLAAGQLSLDLSLAALLDSTGVTSSTLCATGGLLGVIGALTGPICGAVDDLVAALAGDVTLPLDLPVDRVDLSDLPVTNPADFLGTGAGGAFTNADCSRGIGAGFSSLCEGTTPTTLTALDGTPPGLGNLSSLISEVLDLSTSGLEVVSLDGDGALMSLGELLDALSAVEGTLSPLVDELLTSLSSLSNTEQVDLLNEVFGISDLLLGELTGVGGRYSSFPSLEVDTSEAPGRGEYEGTLIVTMVE